MRPASIQIVPPFTLLHFPYGGGPSQGVRGVVDRWCLPVLYLARQTHVAFPKRMPHAPVRGTCRSCLELSCTTLSPMAVRFLSRPLWCIVDFSCRAPPTLRNILGAQATDNRRASRTTRWSQVEGSRSSNGLSVRGAPNCQQRDTDIP